MISQEKQEKLIDLLGSDTFASVNQGLGLLQTLSRVYPDLIVDMFGQIEVSDGFSSYLAKGQIVLPERLENAKHGLYVGLSLLPKANNRVSHLALNSMSLTKVPSEIGQLHHLQLLNLSCNQLESLPSQIGFLSRLRYLNVRMNSLRHLPETLSELQFLEDFDVSTNPLQSLPSRLSVVTLSPAQLQGFSEQIHKWKDMQNLHVSGRNFSHFLKKVPEDLAYLPSLKNLDLSWNEISILPEAFSTVEGLSIDVRYNPLRKLPSQLTALIVDAGLWRRKQHLICSLETLYRLQIESDSSNQVTHLTAKIANLHSLKELRIRHGGLLSLPHEIGQLSNLKILDVEGNDLESLPSTVQNMLSLERLNIKMNPLSSASIDLIQHWLPNTMILF